MFKSHEYEFARQGYVAAGCDPLIPVEVAKLLVGAKTTKFYALVKAGEITVIKQGTRSFVAASEIRRHRATLRTIGRVPDASADRGHAAPGIAAPASSPA